MSATFSRWAACLATPRDEVFDDAARVQAMLDFESALARAQAQCG